MTPAEYPAYYNGTFCQIQDLKVSILDLGLIHSDATYDVLAIKDGEFVNLEEHLERFRKSCYSWRIPLKYSKEDLEAILRVLHVKMPLDIKDCLVWIAVTRGVPKSGNPRDLLSCEPNFYAYIKPYFGFNSFNTATVCLAKQKRNDVYSQRMKNFAWNDLTLAQWEAIDRGYNTAVLTDRHGYLTEGPGFNIGFISKDGFVYAPRSNCLLGTVMETVREKCNTKGVQFFYTDISMHTVIEDMDAMFLTSTAGNVIPVSKFEDIVFDENEILSWLKNSF